MKTPSPKADRRAQNPATLIAALALAALVPAACVLWFMSVAMRNERLAVQQRLAEVYTNHLASLERQVDAFWKERQAAVQAAPGDSAGEKFAAIVRGQLADSAVIAGGSAPALQSNTLVLEPSGEESAAWQAAREQEYQKKDYAAAAGAYARLVETSRNIDTKARALQAEVACWLKAGRKTEALARLSRVAGDTTLRNAISANGALIAPNAQLLLLKLLDESASGGAVLELAVAEAPREDQARLGTEFLTVLRQRTLDDLVSQLNDYSTSKLPPMQRRFLMRELEGMLESNHNAAAALPVASELRADREAEVRRAGLFPTLAAEDLAASYLESNPPPPTETKFQRTSLPRVWRFATSDRSVVALYREETLKAEIGKLFAAAALPDVNARLLAPGETFSGSKLFFLQEAGTLLPAWRIGLSFRDRDPLAAASVRQARIYLWTGFIVVVAIGLVVFLVARYVAAQMRLARLKNELVSTVSHELKTPLAAMRALVDTLSAGHYRDEDQLRDYLELIAKENLRLSNLIDNFLTFSRLERGRQQFRFETLEPARVVADAVEALQDKLHDAHCKFAQQVEPGLPRIRGDADALSTVLINLLDNAWKYTDAEKRIFARAYATNGHVCFEVADNGIGIARSEARRIFDRFYQVDQSLTRQHGGCGLGLGIVQYIVRAHHGIVQVESEPGKGSTFRVSIPKATLNTELSSLER